MNQRWRQYFGWSKSRAGLFAECRKRYVFQYIYKYEPGTTPAMVKVASKMTTLAITKGSLVHDEIERFLKVFSSRGEEDAAAARHRLATAFDVLGRAKESRLVEAAFGLEAAEDLDRRIREEKEDALVQLDAFFSEHWPRYRDLKILAFEELERFPVGEHPVWVSADLVVEEPDGTVVLVDWKTGRREKDAAESIQLTGYLIWAAERFQVPLGQLAGELVWLRSGRVDRTTRTPKQVQQLRDKIAEDSAAMLAIDDYDAVTASPEEGRCRRCNFLPLCREGAEHLDDGARREALARLRSRV
jgi:predicted RecB family nuclease